MTREGFLAEIEKEEDESDGSEQKKKREGGAKRPYVERVLFLSSIHTFSTTILLQLIVHCVANAHDPLADVLTQSCSISPQPQQATICGGLGIQQRVDLFAFVASDTVDGC